MENIIVNEQSRNTLCWWLKLPIFTWAMFQASSVTHCKMILSCCLAQRSKSLVLHCGRRGRTLNCRLFTKLFHSVDSLDKKVIRTMEECFELEVIWQIQGAELERVLLKRLYHQRNCEMEQWCYYQAGAGWSSRVITWWTYIEEHNAINMSYIYRSEGQKEFLLLWAFLLSIILPCTSVLDHI